MFGTAINGGGVGLQTSQHKTAKAEAPAVPESVKRAAEEFEALFLTEMLAPAFEGLESGGLFGGGQSEKIYRSMMVQEYGKAIAQSGGVGIAESVQREILRMQENQQ